MTEQEKMLAGKIYDPSDETLGVLRTKAHRLCLEYNQLPETDPRRGGNHEGAGNPGRGLLSPGAHSV